MAVKVDDGDRTVGLVHAAEQGQRDGVVSAKGNDTGQGLALGRRSDLLRVGGRLTHENAVVALFDLLDGIGVVVPGRACQLPDSCFCKPMLSNSRCHRDVTAVKNRSPAVERVGLERNVVAAAVWT